MIDFERDVPKVALDFANADHAEATQLLNTLVALLEKEPVDNDAVTRALETFLQHNRDHFAREEKQMAAFDFPPYPVHKGEHDQVLAEMEEELAAWKSSADKARLQHYLNVTVANWFINHIATMDTITSRFVVGAGGPA